MSFLKGLISGGLKLFGAKRAANAAKASAPAWSSPFTQAQTASAANTFYNNAMMDPRAAAERTLKIGAELALPGITQTMRNFSGAMGRRAGTGGLSGAGGAVNQREFMNQFFRREGLGGLTAYDQAQRNQAANLGRVIGSGEGAMGAYNQGRARANAAAAQAKNAGLMGFAQSTLPYIRGTEQHDQRVAENDRSDLLRKQIELQNQHAQAQIDWINAHRARAGDTGVMHGPQPSPSFVGPWASTFYNGR